MSYMDMIHVFIGMCIGLIVGLFGGIAFTIKGGLK